MSLLPLPGKLIEKVAHNKMSIFFEYHNIITDKQSGFRKGFSTMTSIADLTDELYTYMNKGMTTLAAFIDLSKAFDTVDHGILLKKLKCYGIDSVNLRWCNDYLSRRTQKTLANGVSSANRSVTCGVPQGSVLGPLFFILYVNDVQHALRESHLRLYADDTVIYAAGENVRQAETALQPALNKFAKLCSANKLTLNAGKTKMMTFGTRHKVKKARGADIKINNTSLTIVPTYKYLGVAMDSTLSFNYYVKSVANIVAYKSNLLSKIRKYLTDVTALKVYKSMILPYFDYGDIIYMNSNQDGLDKLQRLQNRCLKICKRLDRRHETKDLHVITRCPMLSDRRTAHINNFMYKRLVREHHVDDRDIRTRAHDAPLFRLEVPKLEAYKRSVKYSGASQWNSLPAEVRNIDNFKQFKAMQKNFLELSVREEEN